VADVLRAVLRTTSIVSLAMAGWLIVVVASGRASRGQDLVVLWSIVAVGSAALAAVSMLATRSGPPLTTVAAVALAALGVTAFAFGLFVLVSALTPALSADPEGYLQAIGVILTLHGALALGWLVVRRVEVVE
jgi:hypothetical protein